MFSSSGKSTFDKSLEKATSQQLLEPDWDSILAVCDSIRQGDVKAKYALDCIKKKIGHENPNVGRYGLQVLESVVKNCGPPVHQEIATKESMEFLKDLSRAPKVQEQIKAKILELIQAWSHAFRNDSNYKCVVDTYNDMKRDGVNFPEFKESEAMFAAELAPEWKDGDNCYACRVAFTTFVRKHHCRRCGQIFCSKCSAFNSAIPAFGIEKEVRVCEQCYAKLKKLPDAKDDNLPAAYLASPLSKQSQLPPKRSEEELREQEELNLAIALSQSEAEAKESEKKRQTANWANYSTVSSAPRSEDEQRTSEVIVARAPKLEIDDGVSPELARYLNRGYWEKKQIQQQTLVKTGVAGGGGGGGQPVTQPSAPDAMHSEARSSVAGGGGTEVTSSDVTSGPLQNGDTDAVIDEEFLQLLSSSVDVFVNRMRSDSQRGRSIATDSSVQTLFEALQNMHPRLLEYMHGQEDRRAYHESLQDKLSQLKDARDALTALREEHTERRRREAEERERQRQVQMAQKLDAMRKKKHEYLAHQRQLAIQKMQEQERELQARLEQQKQLTLMRQMQLHGFPQELQPGYAPFQQPMQGGVTGGLYYAGPGGVGPSYMTQQPVGGDMVGIQYQHPALPGQGSMTGLPGPAVPMPHQQQQQQHQQAYPGMGQAPAMQGVDASSSFRMNDIASALPPTSLGMQSFASSAMGMPYGHMGAAAATYQQPAAPADSLAGPTYAPPPGTTVVAGNGGAVAPLLNSIAPSMYQATYYPSQQQLQQQPPIPQAFQPQVPGAFQQQLYQPQLPSQQQQQPPPQAVALPPSSTVSTYQQPPVAQQQYDNQLIIFD